MKLFSLAMMLLIAALPARAAERVLAVGGSITEIVFALGEEDRLIARDSTSQFPAEARALPDVGYKRRLSPEGVLSVVPDLIIAIDDSGPLETIQLLEQADIPFVKIPQGYTPEAVRTKIQLVAEALGVPEKGVALADRIEADLAAAVEAAAGHSGAPKRVMFVLSTRGGRIMASGTGTGAHGIITLAGAENAFADFEGYKQLSDEAIALAAPDVVLMMDRGGNHASSDEELFAIPAMSTIPAAKTRAVVRLDGILMLQFGPRVAQAVTAVNQALYAN